MSHIKYNNNDKQIRHIYDTTALFNNYFFT